ncbi:hypothetical protein IHQ68_06470 [Chelatococcus sambhunathii]|uniref:Uncharacterized protein n=1 Tax=Chelatococcus sambhunathii TaxID=363953 RepID=A0ABU1DE88_9HYPH|nr:hypothetical protein [Chelatococcus sambhunathii]MDR4306260.1 hypothetical protein [Chelatococcus sambhunathii]
MTREFFELLDLWRRQALLAGGFAALAPSAGFVMATRLTDMATTAARPTPDSLREAHRMVSEKLSAAAEGGVAASRALTALAGAAGPVAAAHVMIDAGEAALKPAARALRANERRFSRR